MSKSFTLFDSGKPLLTDADPPSSKLPVAGLTNCGFVDTVPLTAPAIPPTSVA
jgi:hypothetical protein